MEHPVPIPNAYWVEEGRLLAGEYPGEKEEAAARRKLRRFLEAGIRSFIDLTEEGEVGLVPYEDLVRDEAARLDVAVEYRRMPIRDVSVPRNPHHMTDILDAIDEALRRDLGVYVHCWGGSGRTGTVVGCHLVRRGLTGSQALEQVAASWKGVEKVWRLPESPQTHEQRAWVLGWREGTG